MSLTASEVDDDCVRGVFAFRDGVARSRVDTREEGVSNDSKELLKFKSVAGNVLHSC
jgi:hypothetical protein